MGSVGAPPPPPPAAAFNESDRSMICYTPTMTTTNGVWQLQGSNPLRYALPLFVVQLTLVVLATRLFYFVLRPFHQPRLIAEILGGLLLGPSVLGQIEGFAIRVFPMRSVLVLETMAYIGLIYFMFLTGLEMDIDIIKRTGKKAISIAIAGMIFPFLVGFALAHVFQIHHTIKEIRTTHISYIIYLGVVLSVTAFPVLVRMLADLKLVNTELGKLAISTSLINDTCAWALLAVGIAFSQRKAHSYSSLCVFLSSLVFVAVCIFVVRPMVSWMIRRTPEGQPFSETQICIVLTGVIISGFITDALGTHSVFGAFVYGLVIPNGPLAASIIDKLEDFVSGLLLPLFFAISGLKTNLTLIKGAARWGFVILVIPLTFIGKVLGTLFVSLLFQIPVREGVILGLLMNTKGFIEIIVLNVGWEQKVLGDEVFSIMILVTIVMTAIISPTVALIHKPRKRHILYKNRTMQSTAVDAELRILVCIHVPRNVPTIINLLEETNPTIKSPITANVLHLVELTGRASAMLVVHADSIRDRKSGRPLNKTHAQTEHIMSAFRNFEENVDCVSVQPLTVVSPYSTMHEDICSIAEEQRVSFIIIPFHKQQTVAGEMEETIPAYRLVNHNLLQEAPCSVGILVDRGLNGSTRLAAKPTCHQVTVLFFGGPDDREALSYGWRMSRHPRVRLTVMHFVPRKQNVTVTANEEEDNGGENYSNENKCLDEEIMYEVEMIAEHDDSVEYLERVVGNGEETIGAIRAMNSVNDLFIVGRGQGTSSPLTEGLTDWSECPELGAIGDLLASSDFETSASVLVVNQYVEERPDGEDVIITEKPWLATDDDFYQTLLTRRMSMSRRHRFFESSPAMY